MQFVEEVYRQRAEESSVLKCAGRDAAAITQEAFSGRARMAGEAIISPELLTCVAKKVGESSDILKQQLKGLEARGLVAPRNKSK